MSISHALARGDRIFVDSSAYYALAIPRDENHSAAVRLLAQFEQVSVRFFTTRYILAETHALVLGRRRNPREAQAVLSAIERSQTTTIVSVNETDEQRARAILTRYWDHTFSLTDAISFAVMERVGISTAYSFDGDFAEYGFSVFGAT